MAGAPDSAADLFVYGASPAGIGAAVTAAREGLRVLVAEPLGQLGGMLTGGLSRTDLGRPETVGGVFREFLTRVVAHYAARYGPDSSQVKDSLGGQRFEPRVAHAVLSDLLAEAGAEVRLRREIVTAEVEGRRLRAVTLRNGVGEERVRAKAFVDASYEGDLLAAACVPYRAGREARQEYGEEHAGHLFWDPKTSRPSPRSTGEADARVQAYCLRLCVTDDPANRRVLAPPPSYDPARFSLLQAYLDAAPRQLKDVLLLGPLPNRKWDVNNWGFCWQSMDFIEGNAGYVEGDWPARRRIVRAHRDYQYGLLYYLQHDRGVPADLRAEASRYGLCADEFPENDGWPEQLYVREARRMLGRYVFTEHDARRDSRKPDAVVVGSYPLDSHATQWYRLGQPDPASEGFFMCSTRPYEIPFRALLPADLDNLLVPVCLSATHAGYGTLRMEPVMMNLGMACGLAAALSPGGPANVDVAELQRELAGRGQVVRV